MNKFSSLFRKEAGIPDFSPLICDLHSHLIPGIDDGAPDLETSLVMIQALSAAGFRKAVTTPHIMADAYRNTPEIIRAGCEILSEAIRSAGMDFRIEAAAEYYLDENFESLSRGSDLLSFGGESKYILFETSYISKPLSFDKVVFDLQSAGYKPVFAHPERYSWLWESTMDQFLEMKERGLLFQVNIGSFSGAFDIRARKIARQLARAELVDFLGSDIHRPVQAESWRRAWARSQELRELVKGGRLRNGGLG